MKVNPFRLAERIPSGKARNLFLDVLLTVTIPFNRWLGFRIEHLGLDRVVCLSPEAKLRENHVGGAHACALALLGEYPAGLLVAQKFPIDEYRMIISNLNIDYKKQGRGALVGIAEAPVSWPELVDGQAWIDMSTMIRDARGDVVAECKTKWQVKKWSAVHSAS